MPETEKPNRQQVEEIVRRFAAEFWSRLRHQVGQMVPGTDMNLPADIWHQNILERTMESQEWMTMALYGVGLVDEDPGYIHEICQGMAEWLFAIPDTSAYGIPDAWKDSPMGQLWWAAILRAEGDELITLQQAADLSGVTLNAIVGKVNRGTLDSFVDPFAPPRQGRRLVRKSQVLPKS
jgi:hypothetical protein